MAKRSPNLVAQAADLPPTEAEALLKKHLRKRPRDFAALEALAGVLASQSRLPEVASNLVKAAMTDRASEGLILKACEAAQAMHEAEAALHLAHRGTKRYPNSWSLWYMLGKSQMATSDAPSAATSLERAHSLAPDNMNVLAALADADLSRGAFPVPDRHARELLNRAPQEAVHHVRLGTAHRFNDQLDDAETCFRQAIDLDPTLQTAHAGLAETLESKGDSQSASDQLEPLISGGMPSFTVVSAWARVQQQLGHSDRAIEAMEQYLAAARGTQTHRNNVLMRLGRAYEKAGRHSDAFRCWTQGNQTHKGRWNPETQEALIEQMMTALNGGQLASLPRAAPASITPILVVGMYRSGTTLTEQILSAHPDIAPVGESPAMPRAVEHLASALGPLDQFPGSLAGVTRDQLEAARDVYISEVTSFAGDAPYIVDKLPLNYLNLGIASLILPQARVLHLMRDPLDTALSCYSQSFASRMAFTADLDHLGRALVQERRIMRHWHEASDLPIQDVKYEDMVSTPETVLPIMLEFIGLPWTDALMRFHTSTRVAATPSMDQVRRPINTSAIGRAAPFGELLDPLRQALGDLS
ncbi:MAG: sulfotransferase [Phycisphaerales bacterium]|nr:sulfotransferase [Phycisphaerales bacterium]